MVWKIFAPRLLFAIFGLGVTTFGIVVALILLISVHTSLNKWTSDKDIKLVDEKKIDNK